jgi:GNAT superfamily N-acetyltransferase
MTPGDEAGVADLVWNVFLEFVAPVFEPEGIEEFRSYVRIDTMADRLKTGNFGLLAESEQGIVGVIEIRDHRHIALLFVDKACQRRGIATQLIHRSIEICRKHNPDIRTITVNASPNAVAAYRSVGFKATADLTVANGMRFVPMKLQLDCKSLS